MSLQNRDEFPESVKRTLGERVGYVCSNPSCCKPTIGPNPDPNKSLKISVAAHIAAAAPGGARYDRDMSSKERKSIQNGIHLCQNCGDLIDKDEINHSTELLHEWKLKAEARALGPISGGSLYKLSNDNLSSGVIPEILISQYEQLSSVFSEEKEHQLDNMRAAWREGRNDHAINELQKIKGDDRIWPILTPKTKAKLLRFEAGMELDSTGSIDRARALADEAHSLAPSENEARIRSIIAYHECGLDKAIKVLGEILNIEDLNLKAGFLLQLGRYDECHAVLNAENIDYEPNAETYRLRALLAFTSKDLEKAYVEVQMAQKLAPRWTTIQYTAAIINFFKSLSPVALPGNIVSWPEPIDQSLFQQDPKSLERLSIAEKIFKDLIRISEEDGEERRRLQVWRLASLACHLERKEEAMEYCQIILKHDPTHPYIIPWIAAQQFEVNLQKSERSFEKLLEKRDLEIPEILALVICYFVSKNIDKASALLEKTEKIFIENESRPMWIFWIAQSLLKKKDYDAALERIELLDTDGNIQQLKTVVLWGQAQSIKNWEKLIDHLEGCYKQTQNPQFLFDLCQAKAHQNDWSYVAEHSEKLINEYRTVATLQLAIYATYNTAQYGLCLRMLIGNQYIFGGEQLPFEFRRLLVNCQQKLGLMPEARTEAEALYRDDPSSPNLVALATLYFNTGDMARFIVLSKTALERMDIEPHTLLSLASSILGHNNSIATELWKKACKQDLNDDDVSAALQLGYELNQENEMRSLFSRMQKMAIENLGGIQLKTTKDLPEFIRARHKQAEDLDRAYLHGKIPVHLIVDKFNQTLANFYHLILQENKKDSQSIDRFPLLARHGGRSIISGFPEKLPCWQLHVDVTSLLLANHIEILDQVEETFECLHIPGDLILSLRMMQRRLRHHQPGKLEKIKRIVDLEKQSLIMVVEPQISSDDYSSKDLREYGEEWLAYFELVCRDNGYLVEFLPLRGKSKGVSRPAMKKKIEGHLVSIHAMLESLRKHGPLSQDNYDKALFRLGDEGSATASEVVPRINSPLYLSCGIALILVEADLLDTICKTFQVHMDQRELNRFYSEINKNEKKIELIQWLEKLIERISNGQESGRFFMRLA